MRPMHERRLQELTITQHAHEFVFINEMIVDTIHLTRAWFTSGIGNGKLYLLLTFQQCIDQTGLPCPGCCCNYKEIPSHHCWTLFFPIRLVPLPYADTQLKTSARRRYT